MGAPRIDCSREAASVKGEKYLAVWDGLQRCSLCHRPMRPHRGKRQDWPATVSRATKVMCTGCYNNGGKVGPRISNSHAEAKRRSPMPEDRAVHVDSNARQEAAAHWTAEQRSVAVLVCDRVQGKQEILETLDMIGLFDTFQPTVRDDFYDGFNEGISKISRYK